MGIFNTGVNFANLQNTVDAARSLQDAGRDKDARKILNDLANEIIKETKTEESDQ